jgi:hypothetical protein
MTMLLQSVSVDTNGTGIPADGGSKTLSIWADNFGGGSVTIQGSPDGGTTWITLTYGGNPAVFTSNTVRLINRLGQGMQVRATLTGSSGASNVNADLYE